jgi:hypothetical protein
MRIVLLLLLSQFIAPAFLPLVMPDINGSNNLFSYHPVHTSVLIPIILKEKEENEQEDAIQSFVPTQLIDFTDHSLALTQLHQSKHNVACCGQWYDHQPPLFALHCTFII